jgi:hypothetical protein
MIELKWKGPFSWPKFENENGLPSIPKEPGLYIQSANYNEGYITYCAGISRRPIPTRFQEHTRSYFKGNYNILDINLMQQGIRKVIWQGWGWSDEKKITFKNNESLLQDAVRKQLLGFRIFVVDIGLAPRLLERLEAKVMLCLYHSEYPYCDLPDKGMKLSPRRDDEPRITVKNNCEKPLFGIPVAFEI